MDKEILGYTQVGKDNWEPIHECKKGYIYSAAVVSCQKCKKWIRGMGGPLNALCVDCYNKPERYL